MKLDLRHFFHLIKNTSYILVKIDTPYVPKDFPDSYAIGKDLDIIINRHDLTFFRHILEKYAHDYKDDFEMLTREVDNGVRLRFEKKGKLHFQLDVSCGVNGVDEFFVKASIDNRKAIDDYFVAEERYEMIYRYFYYQKKKKKKYHLRYIREHMDKVDDKLLKEVGINFDGIV